MAELFIKDPAAAWAKTLSLESAATAIVETVVQPQGLVPGAGEVAAVASIVSGAVSLSLTGGTDGERYDIVVRADTATAGLIERLITVAVIDPAWTMPDGATAYLSIIEFVDRFGLDEAIAATDASGAGVMDRKFLVGALSDAQAEVEAELAARYALPIAVVPAILKAMVADLAAVRMYRRGAPDHVIEQAKVQRRKLERISSGALPLPLPAGVTAASAASDAPIDWHSGGRTYPDNLADY
jgi:phage gp36-like protein